MEKLVQCLLMMAMSTRGVMDQLWKGEVVASPTVVFYDLQHVHKLSGGRITKKSQFT